MQSRLPDRVNKVIRVLEENLENPVYLYNVRDGIISLTGLQDQQEFMNRYPVLSSYKARNFLATIEAIDGVDQYGIEYPFDPHRVGTFLSDDGTKQIVFKYLPNVN